MFTRIHIRLLCTLLAYLAPLEHNTTRQTIDRQTDIAIEIYENATEWCFAYRSLSRALWIFCHIATWNTKERTNCGSNAVDVLGNFFSRQTMLVHLRLLWLHNAYRFWLLLRLPPFGHNLKGEFGGPHSLMLMEVGAWGRVMGSPIEIPPTRLPNTPRYKVLLYLPPFGLNSNITSWRLPPIRPPFGEGEG